MVYRCPNNEKNRLFPLCDSTFWLVHELATFKKSNRICSSRNINIMAISDSFNHLFYNIKISKLNLKISHKNSSENGLNGVFYVQHKLYTLLLCKRTYSIWATCCCVVNDSNNQYFYGCNNDPIKTKLFATFSLIDWLIWNNSYFCSRAQGIKISLNQLDIMYHRNFFVLCWKPCFQITPKRKYSCNECK